MPSLRRVIVHLDFISEKGGPVIASSVPCAGYMGVLTGVRRDFSLSLNFRPNRVDNGKFWSDLKYGWHHLMVLLGRRQSISSLLRQFLLPQPERKRIIPWLPFTKKGGNKTLDYAEIIKTVVGENGKSKPITTTACYPCFSNGQEAKTIEKDRISAVVRSSTDFIVVTNSDEDKLRSNNPEANEEGVKATPAIPDLDLPEVAAEAKDRAECARSNWNTLKVAKSQKRHIAGRDTLCTTENIIKLTRKHPTTNECTHFAYILDPAEGTVAWCRRWMKPVGVKWIRAHMSETW